MYDDYVIWKRVGERNKSEVNGSEQGWMCWHKP